MSYPLGATFTLLGLVAVTIAPGIVLGLRLRRWWVGLGLSPHAVRALLLINMVIMLLASSSLYAPWIKGALGAAYLVLLCAYLIPATMFLTWVCLDKLERWRHPKSGSGPAWKRPAETKNPPGLSADVRKTRRTGE